MIATKRLDASTIDKVVDSSEPIDVLVTVQHCKKALRGDPEKCALVLAAREQGNFTSFIVHRSIAYGQRVGSTKWLRYQSAASTRKFVEQFDKGDFSGVKDGGLTFTFRPPRRSLSLKFLRHGRKNMKKKKKSSRRPYRLPDPKTLEGVRNRFGYH